MYMCCGCVDVLCVCAVCVHVCVCACVCVCVVCMCVYVLGWGERAQTHTGCSSKIVSCHKVEAIQSEVSRRQHLHKYDTAQNG